MIPAHWVGQGIRIALDGTVWADFHVVGPSVLMLQAQARLEDATAAQQHFFAGLKTDAVLASYMAPVQDVRLGSRTEDTLKAVEKEIPEVQLFERVQILSVMLTSHGRSIGRNLLVGTSPIRRWCGLPGWSPSPRELAEFLAQARNVAENVQAPKIQCDLLTTQQQSWCHRHMVVRGTDADVPFPTGAESEENPEVPSAQSRVTGKLGRVLCISTPAVLKDCDDSFQSSAVLSKVNSTSIPFPQTALFQELDKHGGNVEWSLFIEHPSETQSKMSSSRAANKAAAQVEESASSQSNEAYEVAASREATMVWSDAVTSGQREVRISLVVSCAARQEDTALQNLAQVVNETGEGSWYFEQPVGRQRDLWNCFFPGTVQHAGFMRDYREYTTDLSASNMFPLLSSDFGDQSGLLLGWDISHAPLEKGKATVTRPIFLDTFGKTDQEVSASIAIVGSPGGGKTSLMKMIAYGAVDADGHVVIVDPTTKGEWEVWASALPGVSMTVDPLSNEVSVDPLRVLGVTAGADLAASFLAEMLDVQGVEELAQDLSEVCSPAYLDEYNISSMMGLMNHLLTCRQGKAELGRRLRIFERSKYRGVLFDDRSPALQPHTQATVFRTSGLKMPSEPTTTRSYSSEELFSVAYFGLICAITQRFCLAQSSVNSAFLVSEARSLRKSAVAQATINSMILDGRKHRTAVVLDTQSPEDLGSAATQRHITQRFGFRCSTQEGAQQLAEWIGLGTEEGAKIMRELSSVGTDKSMKMAVPEYKRGEAVFLDASGTIGRVKVQLPIDRKRRDAIERGGSADPVGVEQLC